MLFIMHLRDAGMQHSTITTYVSAIAFAHKVRGLEDPTSAMLFRKFMMGVKKVTPTLQQLQPITYVMLKELLGLLESLPLSRFTKILYAAVLSVMYHACLRISEVAQSGHANHALRYDQVAFKVRPPRVLPAALTMTLLSFKHSKGPQTIQLKPITDEASCPVGLMYRYHRLRPSGSTTSFFCDEAGRPITRTSVMTVLRQVTELSSFRHKKINTHSLRIGRTTDLVLKGGVSDAYIRHVGRWSSDAYRKYIRSIVVL